MACVGVAGVCRSEPTASSVIVVPRSGAAGLADGVVDVHVMLLARRLGAPAGADEAVLADASVRMRLVGPVLRDGRSVPTVVLPLTGRDMRVDIGVGMCINVRLGMCTNMRFGICIDMWQVGTCLNICLNTRQKHVYTHK